MNDIKYQDNKIAIIGGGLVGLMMSCFLAKRGFNVTIYEKRADPRVEEYTKERQINIDFAERGRFAMKALGLEHYILRYSNPIDNRIIYNLIGSKKVIALGIEGQFIYSMNRSLVHEILLTEVDKHNNICIKFKHELDTIDLNRGTMTFLIKDDSQRQITTSADIIIGCDGAFSKMRSEIDKIKPINYHHQFHDQWFIRLKTSNKGNENTIPRLERNCMHSWTRGEVHLNGKFNHDQSFSFSLNMPLKRFERIKNQNDLIHLFEDNFPDLIEIFGIDWLKTIPTSLRPSPYISIKCSSYNYLDKVLLMGDAVHAMLPFLGQGMNCGLEDCIILDELLSQHNNNLREVLPLFSKKRVEDCNTIVDLSMDRYNYSYTDSKKTWLLASRNSIDLFLHRLLSSTWIPIYGMLAFTRIPYKKCLEYRRWQNKVIDNIVTMLIFISVLVVVLIMINVISHE